MNNFMMKMSNIIPEWLLEILQKREIESEEVNFKVTKAKHFLSSYTFYFVQLKKITKSNSRHIYFACAVRLKKH
jgi:hypothetical protein